MPYHAQTKPCASYEWKHRALLFLKLHYKKPGPHFWNPGGKLILFFHLPTWQEAIQWMLWLSRSYYKANWSGVCWCSCSCFWIITLCPIFTLMIISCKAKPSITINFGLSQQIGQADIFLFTFVIGVVISLTYTIPYLYFLLYTIMNSPLSVVDFFLYASNVLIIVNPFSHKRHYFI